MVKYTEKNLKRALSHWKKIFELLKQNKFKKENCQSFIYAGVLSKNDIKLFSQRTRKIKKKCTEHCERMIENIEFEIKKIS